MNIVFPFFLFFFSVLLDPIPIANHDVAITCLFSTKLEIYLLISLIMHKSIFHFIQTSFYDVLISTLKKEKKSVCLIFCLVAMGLICCTAFLLMLVCTSLLRTGSWLVFQLQVQPIVHIPLRHMLGRP